MVLAGSMAFSGGVGGPTTVETAAAGARSTAGVTNGGGVGVGSSDASARGMAAGRCGVPKNTRATATNGNDSPKANRDQRRRLRSCEATRVSL